MVSIKNMTKKEIQEAWQEIRSEIINKPKVKTPYSRKIIIIRELLALAQMALEKIESGENIIFYQQLHKKMMPEYYRQKACLKI